MSNRVNFRRDFLNALEGKTPRQDSGPFDPNRLVYPYLKTSELPPGESFKIRVMPDNPKCPNGHVKIRRWKLVMPGTGMTFVHCPTNMGGDEFFEPVLRSFNSFIASNKEARDKLVEISGAVEAIETLAKPWDQYVVSVLIWAECDARKNASGWTEYTNYRPSRDKYITRALQVNVNQISRAWLQNTLPPNENSDPEYFQINGEDLGANYNFKIDNTNKMAPFQFTPAGLPGSLPGDIREKLENPDNHCDLIKELEKKALGEKELMSLLLQSVAGQAMQAVGFFSNL